MSLKSICTILKSWVLTCTTTVKAFSLYLDKLIRGTWQLVSLMIQHVYNPSHQESRLLALKRRKNQKFKFPAFKMFLPFFTFWSSYNKIPSWLKIFLSLSELGTRLIKLTSSLIFDLQVYLSNPTGTLWELESTKVCYALMQNCSTELLKAITTNDHCKQEQNPWHLGQ